jgi:hypothetical protein
MKQIKIVFNCNHIIGEIKKNIGINGNQPPKNNKLNKVDINKILPYSPKKKKAKIIDEYSKL